MATCKIFFIDIQQGAKNIAALSASLVAVYVPFISSVRIELETCEFKVFKVGTLYQTSF